MLQSFIPLFMMTFFICLFIVLMQFLWRYIDDLVGKGLEISVIVELFFYAALTMVPMALPLAILLASLMTFGNLGERFELMAIKAAGISLIKAMRPLIVFIILVAIGAFFFQNNVMPIAQAKMYSLLISMRQKSPELEIPEGVFYDQIPGYNIFVEEKNRETGTLYGMMIYDVSRGADLERVRIIIADSGKMSITENKTHLFLKLYSGEQFENLRDQANASGNVPYRRESFSLKEILIPFDNNFNRMDENNMRKQYVGKNISQLNHSIDSISSVVDSISNRISHDLRVYPYFSLPRIRNEVEEETPVEKSVSYSVDRTNIVPFDSIISRLPASMQRSVFSQAASKARHRKQDYEFRSYSLQGDLKSIRMHKIELQKKFTLSIACLIFFFIGAPLGAIIRKGGLGTPLVISVLLFIFYYVIDNSGFKLARDGSWSVWQGIWLSTAVLLPLGIFLTYKAKNDSSILNTDAYLNFFRRFFGISEVRRVEMKELAMETVDAETAVPRVNALTDACRKFLADNPPAQNYFRYFLYGINRTELQKLADLVEETVDFLSNSKDKLLINKLGDYPVLRNLFLYCPTPNRKVAYVAMALFPLAVPVWLLGRKMRRDLRHEIEKILKLNEFTISQLEKQ